MSSGSFKLQRCVAVLIYLNLRLLRPFFFLNQRKPTKLPNEDGCRRRQPRRPRYLRGFRVAFPTEGRGGINPVYDRPSITRSSYSLPRTDERSGILTTAFRIGLIYQKIDAALVLRCHSHSLPHTRAHTHIPRHTNLEVADHKW